MIIGVIGNGFVGKATSILKNNNVELLIYDANPTTLMVGLLNINNIFESSIYYITVNKISDIYLRKKFRLR
jgi:hypothetical protein